GLPGRRGCIAGSGLPLPVATAGSVVALTKPLVILSSRDTGFLATARPVRSDCCDGTAPRVPPATAGFGPELTSALVILSKREFGKSRREFGTSGAACGGIRCGARQGLGQPEQRRWRICRSGAVSQKRLRRWHGPRCPLRDLGIQPGAGEGSCLEKVELSVPL